MIDTLKLKKLVGATLLTSSIMVLGGCLSTNPLGSGGQGAGTVKGAAGGESAANNNTELEKCDSTLGTMSVFEDRTLPWWSMYQRRAPDLGSTIPVIRLMIQQSNCFVIVERGAAMQALKAERELMESGESRAGSNFGKGQMVAADYTLSPSVQFAEQTGGGGAILGALLGPIGSVVAGAFDKNEAATTLLLIDNRSGVQLSGSVGSAENYDFSFAGGLFGGGAFAGAGAYANTPEGKIIIAAFADSYNQMVASLRNYKAQQVDGGLGAGGKLKVN